MSFCWHYAPGVGVPPFIGIVAVVIVVVSCIIIVNISVINGQIWDLVDSGSSFNVV